MFPRMYFLVLLLGLMVFVIPAGAHVPLGVAGNTDLKTAFSIDDPSKTYVIYGILENTGDTAYYRFSLKAGDRLDLSLTNAGPLSPVPDMIILSPGVAGKHAKVSSINEIPAGYDALLVNGHASVPVEYEPFTPAAVYEVASYSSVIQTPGIYYVAIVSKENDTHYSFAPGYKEEFSPSEWVLVPVSTIRTHIWEDQSILAILAPFISVFILGIIVIARREHRKGSRTGTVFWLATLAGLLYLGGAALTLVQMFRVLQITGPQSLAIVTLIFAAVPAVLGIFALRLSRRPTPLSLRDRISLCTIAVLGFVFWAGLIIGPVCAMIAALVPDRTRHNS
jgi:hypothetical protein